MQTDNVFARKEYIEREKAYTLAKRICDLIRSGNYHIAVLGQDILGFVDDLPAADVAPVRHGRWKEENPDCLDGDSIYVCSVCGETWTLIEGTPLDNNMHYCPNCGARMDGDGE